jgi:D-hexose-6-phosphate mutarotase
VVKKEQAMSGLADDEWTQMICVELSKVSEFAVDLPPGKQHEMKATVEVADL